MHLYIFTTFHAREGCEAGVARALLAVVRASRAEAGCLAIHAFRSIRDHRLFYIHSQWQDEAAFDRHAGLSHTVRFIDEVAPLIDHSVQAIRTHLLE